MYVVSNTEVTSWSLCRRQHHYRFDYPAFGGKGIEPKWFNLPLYLYRGILGHEALAVYYTAMKEGKSIAECKRAAFAVLQRERVKVAHERPDDYDRMDLIKELKTLIDLYSHHYDEEPFKVLEVETVHQVQISEDILSALRLDLLVEYIRGRFKGHVMIMDHKFVYNFFTALKLKLNSQMPKYIKTVADDLGIIVTKAVLNQIRHRTIKDASPEDIFKRELVTPTPAKMKNIWNEQIEIADKIAHSSVKPLRTLSDLSCRSCLFHTICDAELEDQPVKDLILTQYQPNKYGYTNLLEGE